MKRLTLKRLVPVILALALPFALVSCDEGSDDSQKNMMLVMMLANSGVAPITWYNMTNVTTFDTILMVTPEERDAWDNYGTIPKDYLNGLMEPEDEKKMSINETGFHEFFIFDSNTMQGCYDIGDVVEGAEYFFNCLEGNLEDVSAYF